MTTGQALIHGKTAGGSERHRTVAYLQVTLLSSPSPYLPSLPPSPSFVGFFLTMLIGASFPPFLPRGSRQEVVPLAVLSLFPSSPSYPTPFCDIRPPLALAVYSVFAPFCFSRCSTRAGCLVFTARRCLRLSYKALAHTFAQGTYHALLIRGENKSLPA